MMTSSRPSRKSYEAELERKLAESGRRSAQAGWLALGWQGALALVPLAQAGEIFTPTPLQRLPHSQPWVCGVAGLRGNILLVFDWAQLLGCAAPGQATPTALDAAGQYWVSLSPALGIGSALCADRLLGLRYEQSLEFAPATGHPSGVQRLARDAQGQQWLELDLPAICSRAAFQNLLLSGFSRSEPTLPPT
ncbi:MAG: chemotaxis protein CheW [Betaproteobacteria bacterium]|nr:chemotaxis protein CheW [Betaproteobacteria bacterium]